MWIDATSATYMSTLLICVVVWFVIWMLLRMLPLEYFDDTKIFLTLWPLTVLIVIVIVLPFIFIDFLRTLKYKYIQYQLNKEIYDD